MPSNDALFEMIVLPAMTSFFMSNPDRCCVIVSHGLSPSCCAEAYSDSAGIAVYYWTFLKRIIARLAEVCRRVRPSDLESQPPLLNPSDSTSWSIPIIELASLFVKMLANFCRDLAIGHLVNCFTADDPSSKSFIR